MRAVTSWSCPIAHGGTTSARGGCYDGHHADDHRHSTGDTPVIVAQRPDPQFERRGRRDRPFQSISGLATMASLSDDFGTITGSLTSNLVINPAAAGDSGSYFVIVAGAVNSVTSRVLPVVNVGTAPFVYSPPSSTNVIGATVTLPAQAGGALPLTFHWRKNGTVLANSGTHLTGATTANLTLAGLTSADAGSYSLVVTNAFGGATSAVTVLTVVPPPMITAQPTTPLNVAEGGNLGLHVGVNGTGTLTYQWFSNNVMVADGEDVSGSTAANLVINPASLGNSGSYFVKLCPTPSARPPASFPLSRWELVPAS